MVTAAMIFKDASWKKSYDQPRQHIEKQRHYFANKGPSSQSYGFSVVMYGWEKAMEIYSSVLAWRIPGMGSLVGCHLWGHTESDTTEAT